MKKIFILIAAIFISTSVYASKSIDIDLSNQKIYAKENGRVVFSGSIASGKPGRTTPTGTFRILEKDRFHVSNKYPKPNGGAKMPYMHRLTKSGIAIHQGYLPGYPASHGCIRVSRNTALKLWRWSRRGIKVRVFGSASNFRYAKRRYYKKSISKSKRYTKKRYKRKHYAKSKRRVHKKRRARHYAKTSASGYKVVEIYDSW